MILFNLKNASKQINNCIKKSKTIKENWKINWLNGTLSNYSVRSSQLQTQKKRCVLGTVYIHKYTIFVCIHGVTFFLKFMEHIGDGNFGKKVKFRKKSTKQVNLILKWYVDR